MNVECVCFFKSELPLWEQTSWQQWGYSENRDGGVNVKGFFCAFILTVPLQQAARRSGRSAGRHPVCIWWLWPGLCWPEPLRCYWGGGGRNEERVLNKIRKKKKPSWHLADFQMRFAQRQENKGMTNPKGGTAGEQRSPKCWHFTLD